MKIADLYQRHVADAPSLAQSVGGGDQGTVAQVQVGILMSEGILPSMRILEVGSGIGRIWHALQHHFDSEVSEYLGIDVVPELVTESERLSRELGLDDSKIKFASIDDIGQLPTGFEATSIFGFSVFTHMEPEDIYEYLRKLTTCSAPGAKSLFTFLPLETNFGRTNFLQEAALRFDERFSRVRNVAMTRSMAEELLRLAGWQPLCAEWRERSVTRSVDGHILTNQAWIVSELAT